MEVRLEKLKTMRAAHVHALSETPEEDAMRKIMEWAGRKGLLGKGSRARLFGRNTYPTDKPEPHGYEFMLTVEPNVKPDGDIDVKEIPSGSYAALRFKNIEKMGEAWGKLLKWVDESGHKQVGLKKTERGWANSGYEELLNWYENKPPNEWVFDLWVQLKE
jgi:effector-binding domain-containing protein